ncbi:TonB-dependent receptor [Emcibacter sp.]|uniref:TonB-dependent receptor n=1 Tax=Emcibacter sp. TaxID=1979954 RepID=UPI003A908BCF
MNRTPIKSKFLHSVSLASILAGAVAVTAPGWASAQEADEGFMLEEITVTARRRSESLQSVPVAVTAFSGDSLDQIGAQDITYLAQSVPNTTLEVSRGTNTTITAFMRGVGQQDPVAGFESGVGIYLDDVYLNRPQGAVLEIYDVERIEVLRGPQGTLYGRNTIGGAIKYVTKRLGDETEVRVKGSVGTYMQLDGLVSASTPISDSFKIGGSVGYFSRDGFGENLTNGKEHYDKNLLGTRLTTEFTPTDNLFIRIMGDYSKDTSNEKSGHRLQVGNLTGAPVLDDVFDTRAGIVGEQKVTQGGVSGLIEWNFNEEVTFKSITAYREDDTTTPIDFDSLPAADLDVPAIYKNDQFSQELQVLYEGEKLQGMVGFYYLKANAYHSFDVVLGGLGVTAYTLGDVDTDTWAIFADVNYDINEEFSINLGGRYTSDKRSAQVLRQTYLGLNSPAFGNDDTVLIAQPADFDRSRTDEKFTPKVTVKWQPDEDINVYASYSQGFKGGSFDPRGDDRAAEGFKPEILSSYELGVKSTLADGRVNMNVATFFSDYKDVQIPGSVAIDTDNDGTNDSFVGTVTNAGKAEIWGMEFEMTALVSENLTANVALGYINADYKEWLVQGVDISDDKVFQNTPEWTMNFTLNHASDLGMFGEDGTLNIIGAISYKSKIYQFEDPNHLLDQEGIALLDTSIVWTSADSGLRIGLHGKNLTNDHYKVAGYNFPTLGLEGSVTAFYGNPRTFTLTAEYAF